MTDWNEITARIAAVTGGPFRPGPPRALAGGCVNRAFVLRDGERACFVKLNGAQRLDMFEAEAAGLEALAAAEAIRVPAPLCMGTAGDEAFLALEYIPFGTQRRGSGAEAGERLAALHRQTQATFGWHRDNYIGSTPQPNVMSGDWASFWREWRLGYQLDLALAKGFGGRLWERGQRLLEECPALLDHAPAPSLLHGDLWAGNLAYDTSGQPVLFDPAVYYGDREADLAMTELFGGFDADFHAAYRAAWPLAPGYNLRRDLYNLYHILNHLNLFGAGYLGQAQNMIDRLELWGQYA